MPDRNRCWFAEPVVSVKRRHGGQTGSRDARTCAIRLRVGADGIVGDRARLCRRYRHLGRTYHGTMMATSTRAITIAAPTASNRRRPGLPPYFCRERRLIRSSCNNYRLCILPFDRQNPSHGSFARMLTPRSLIIEVHKIDSTVQKQCRDFKTGKLRLNLGAKRPHKPIPI